MIFSTSPIEAALWTSFVSLQDFVARVILSSAPFRLAVVCAVGFLFVRSVVYAATGRLPGLTLARFCVTASLMSLGLFAAGTEDTRPFSPLSPTGTSWSSYSGVRSSKRFASLRGENPHGLLVYRLIQAAIDGLSRSLTEQIARAFDNPEHSKSPFLFYQTLAQTAGATLTEPAHIEAFTWLLANCERKDRMATPSAIESLSALFDLASTPCRERYTTLRADLVSWSRERTGTDLANTIGLALQSAGVHLGLTDRQALENKRIASALANTLRSLSGTMGGSSVNKKALLADEGPLAADTGASAWVSLLNSLSLGGALHPFASNLFGLDTFGADSRNEMAWMYNKLIQFLPPIRGYAKGILALGFVVASAALCFGFTGPFVGWLGASAVWAAYEPLSTLLYHTTLLFCRAEGSVEAAAALRTDPFVVAGAALVDANLARIQAVYFALQLGLAAATAWAGLSVFSHARRLGSGASGALTAQLVRTTQLVSPITRGGLPS